MAEEFDDSAFSGRQVVLPTTEFFPDPYDGSKKAVRKLLDRVCEYMDVVPDLVALKFVADAGKLWLVNDAGHYLPGAAGTYEEGERRFIIRIDKSGLGDAMGLVGTIAHELAHVRLLGESRMPRGVRQRGANRPDGGPLRAGHLSGQYATELGQPVQQMA